MGSHFKNYVHLWWLSWSEVVVTGHASERGPIKDHFIKVWFPLTQQFDDFLLILLQKVLQRRWLSFLVTGLSDTILKGDQDVEW